ncbi:amino acid ABC transporter permease [Bacillus altitudinis]|uniref:amino acid ABC transporter permease n=1 Tax=Bacillus pumilus TaxID=1408 RepID=UPI0025A29ADF|nr:amino acid ABC transporter permease [Bacillus pumilus]MDM5321719.1 amino acid ABC transporter permease [Bacillus pumilus]MDR4994832.1 amino acid ABC transporter permease [Bacillus altitudinis]
MEMIVLPTLSHFFQTLIDSRGVFLEGMLLTLQLTVISIFIGMFIGLFFALLKISRVAVFGYIANAYIFLVRGTPLIVQIFILYFGLTELNIPDFWAASIALAFHNGAYIAEIFRGAIQSIDQGQKEAGRSLGMGRFLTMRRIILPQAMRRALPPLGNQFIIGLKDSSLAAFISVNELFNVATTQGSNSFDNMTYLLVVAVYYLVLVLLLTFAVQTFEKKLSVSDH